MLGSKVIIETQEGTAASWVSFNWIRSDPFNYRPKGAQ